MLHNFSGPRRSPPATADSRGINSIMSLRYLSAVTALLLIAQTVRTAEDPDPPSVDINKPLLRLEAGGPTAYVTALAFDPDGTTLYAAGWDKVVRVWRLKNGQFELDPREAYRVPLTAGMQGGNINAIALSPDGNLLAVAGNMLVRGAAGSLKRGVMGKLWNEALEDLGTIYVFHTGGRPAPVHRLRGHRGAVLSLAFAPQRKGDDLPLLVSTARQQDFDANVPVDAMPTPGSAVRVWDLSKDTTKRSWTGLPALTRRPGLAAWRAGEDGGQLQIGVALDDGYFRVGELDSPTLRSAPDGFAPNANSTLTYLSGQQRLLSGSFQDTGLAVLRSWRAAPEEKPQVNATVAELRLKDNTPCWPVALAAWETVNPAHVRAAAVLEPRDREKDYELILLDLDGRHTGETVARVSLWSVGAVKLQPVLAVAPGGRYLAVAGNREHSIYIYPLAGLREGKDERLQTIQSSGESLRFVRFVKKGQDRGLTLRPTPGQQGGEPVQLPIPQGQIFNPTARKLLSQQDGWQDDTAQRDGWQIEKVEKKEPKPSPLWTYTLTVSRQGQEQCRIALPSVGRLTDYALLPPRPLLGVPVVAVATLDRSFNPLLSLYHGKTGQKIRQLTGHLGDIHSVAFSSDGKLLASTAEDQTVCVWSLTDLDQILKNPGVLQGVFIQRDKQGRLVVKRINADDLDKRNQALLEKGDVIEGVVEGGQLRRLAQETELLETVSRVRPGEPITLRVRGKDVALVVSQGVDEAKPLLTLFLTRADTAEERNWVAWNPLGLYDSRNVEAENYLGWHINTDDPDQPTKFALIGQYRKRYYLKGMLKTLIDAGQVPKDFKPIENVNDPSLSLYLHDEAGKDFPEIEDGRKLLRRPEARLQVLLDRLPQENFSVKWYVEAEDAVVARSPDLCTTVVEVGRPRLVYPSIDQWKLAW
jgi:WD40 repeat protein